MAKSKKKPSAAQLAAREKFKKMVQARHKKPAAAPPKKQNMARKRKRKAAAPRRRAVTGYRKVARRRSAPRRRRVGAVGDGSSKIMDVLFMIGGAVAANMLNKTLLAPMMATMTAQTKSLLVAGEGLVLMEVFKGHPEIQKMGEGAAVYGGIGFAQSTGLISGFQGGSVTYLNGMNRNSGRKGMLSNGNGPAVGYIRNGTPQVGAVANNAPAAAPDGSAGDLMMLGSICEQF